MNSLAVIASLCGPVWRVCDCMSVYNWDGQHLNIDERDGEREKSNGKIANDGTFYFKMVILKKSTQI